MSALLPTFSVLKEIQGVRAKQWSGEEYDRLVDLGVFDHQRVELINGVIIDMAPMRDDHVVAIGLLTGVLKRAYPEEQFAVLIQCPMELGRYRPEPDGLVVCVPQRKLERKPTSALLAIEISDSTLEYDRLTKAPLYATCVREYWIVNLLDDCLEVFEQPMGGSDPHFTQTRSCRRGESIRLPGVDVTIAVDALLP